MTAFWIFAVGLLLMVGWMVLPTLIKRNTADDVDRAQVNLTLQRNDLAELESAHVSGELDDATYQQACSDLERRVLRSEQCDDQSQHVNHPSLGRKTAVTLITTVPLAAILGYQMLGSGIDAIANDESPVVTTSTPPHSGMAGMSAELPPMDQLTERLALRLQNNPDDAPGWLLLARSYHQLNRQADAQAAYAQAQVHGSEDAELAKMIATPAADGTALPLIAADASVDSLIARTTANPNDGEAWLDLAQAYRSNRDFQAASDAFTKAKQLLPANADLLADFADALAAAQDRRLDGEPAALVDQALQLDPDHPKALWLAATAAVQRNDTEQAKHYWQHLQELLPEDSADRRVIDRNLAALTGEPQDSQQSSMPPPAVISGRVDISPEMRARVKDDDTVFVFAKAVTGPPMPLAVLRKKVRDLPFGFSLDDSLAMQPQLKLSGFDQVMLGVRVSRSGTVTQKPDEPRGDLGPIATRGSTEIQLMIDTAGLGVR